MAKAENLVVSIRTESEIRAEERDRIIALLDTLKCGCDVDCDIVEISFRNLVTLINEEDK